MSASKKAVTTTEGSFLSDSLQWRQMSAEPVPFFVKEGSEILCTIRAAEQASADAKDGIKALQVSYDAFVDDIQVGFCSDASLEELA